MVRRVRAPADASLAAVEAEAIGRASADLGAGRKRKGNPVDPSVGIVFRPKIGDRVRAGEELGEVHARDDEAAAVGVERTLAALTWSASPVGTVPLVHGWFD